MQIADAERAKLLNEKKLSIDAGYSYMDDGIKMQELYVNDSNVFLSMLVSEKWSRKLSARMPPSAKALITLGQDEATFRQF